MGLINSTFGLKLDEWAKSHDINYVVYENIKTYKVEVLFTCRYGEFKITIDDSQPFENYIPKINNRLSELKNKNGPRQEYKHKTGRWNIIIFYLNNTLDELTVCDFGSSMGMFWYQLDNDSNMLTYQIPLLRIEKVIVQAEVV